MPSSMAELAKNRHLIETVRKIEAIKDGFAFASGRLEAINWGERQFGVPRSIRLDQKVQRAGDRVAAPILDGSRQPAFRFTGRPGGNLVRQARLLERVHDVLPADHRSLLSPHARRNQPEQGRFVLTLCPAWASLWVGNALLAILAGFVLPSVVKH